MSLQTDMVDALQVELERISKLAGLPPELQVVDVRSEIGYNNDNYLEIEVYGDTPSQDMTVNPAVIELALALQSVYLGIDWTQLVEALPLILEVKDVVIPESRSYFLYNKENQRLSLFIANIEVLRIDSDGTVKAKGSITGSSL